MAQDRKVFVGGVPQDLNQDDLYAIFCEYAGVKKAWLQKCRNADDGGGGTPNAATQNHRGFGFVIFHEACAIDELLAGGSSRFVVLRNGAKLEVKRALSSNKMGAAAQGEAAAANTAGSQAATATVGARSQETVQPAQPPPPLQSGRNQQQQQLPVGGRWPGTGQQQLLAQWPSAGGANNGDVLRQLSLMQPPANSPTFGNSTTQASKPLSTEPLPALQSAVAYPSQTQQAFTGHNGAEPLSLLMSSHTRPASTEETLQCPVQAQQPQQQQTAHPQNSERQVLLRDAMMRFYYEHTRPDSPTSHDFVDFICSIYEGREGELDSVLRQKYGEGLQIPAVTGHLLPWSDTAIESLRLQGGTCATHPTTGVAAIKATEEGSPVPLSTRLPTVGGTAVNFEPLYVPTPTSVVAEPWASQTVPEALPLSTPGGTWPANNGMNVEASGRWGSTGDNPQDDAENQTQETEGPDFSWVDQIVGDDGLEVGQDVSRIRLDATTECQAAKKMTGRGAGVAALRRVRAAR
jgi:hypothetical protein